MTAEEDLPPEPRLMESMRSVGYTLEAALADLIDNSISALASSIDIMFATSPDDFVGILDNGRGMTRAGARAAMRLAGSPPTEPRAPEDLGRFGLGLKTASLSQCRELCLVTLGEDGLVGLRWDLDRLLQTGRWAIQILSDAEIRALPLADRLINAGRGTLVLWRKLDALRAQVGDDTGMDEAMIRSREHLQLVFHRFLGGENGRRTEIRLNGVNLEALDPFLQSHRATLAGPEETFKVDGETVVVRPFTLPHLNKLNAADRDRATVPGPLRDSQGFYIYRARRLVIWGTWFRIRPREDVAKLARVRVDIPNTLDHLWALDIKKSAAQPPPEVRSRLRRFADRMVGQSRRTYAYRGRLTPETVTRTWQLIEDRDHFRYEINREHPILAEFASDLGPQSLNRLEQIFKLLEGTFPVDDVFNRLGQDKISDPPTQDAMDYVDEARNLWNTYKRSNPNPEEFVNRMVKVEPFSSLPGGERVLRGVIR